MEKVIAKVSEKISEYQILNNLIPGALFCVMLPYVTSYKVLGENVWLNLVIVYFCGIVISRVGSLFVEWLFRKCRFVKFELYPRYIKASEKAPFIKTLSMENNMYRTFISLFLILLLAKLSEYIGSVWSFWDRNFPLILCVLLLGLSIGAYIKQTRYVVNRINEQLKSDETKE